MSAAAATRKIPAPNSNRKSFQNPPPPPSSTRTSTQQSSQIPSMNSSATANGIGRRHTIRENGTASHERQGSISSLRNGITARSAVKRPPTAGGSDTASESELENAAIIDDLNEQLKRAEANAEATAEEYGRQLKTLQMRLGEALDEASKMEELLHQKDDTIEGYEIQMKDLQRAKRDQENIYEAERVAANQEKEDMLEKEEELNIVIQRLKDALTQSQREKASDSEASSGRSSSGDEEGMHFAPSPSSAGPPTPRNNNLLLQKDKIIESLRLEVAEAHIKLAEADHMGGSKVQDLEQRLMELRMANARLMEDNESFQLLLSTATLNGDFSRGDFMTNAFSEDLDTEQDDDKKDTHSVRNSMSVGSTLADELEEVEEQESEKYRKLESELKSVKDQNKALTLYINNIIERLLQHKDFETILDKTPSLGSLQAGVANESNKDKALPPPPPAEETSINILNRTKSMATRSTSKPVPKLPINPSSPVKESEPQPLQRSQSMRVTPTVNTMYNRKDFSATPRAATFFSGDGYTARPSRYSVASSASVASSISDTYSGEVSSPSTSSSGNPIGMIAGNKLRPLRLVQENVGGGMKSPDIDDEKAEKDKRASKRGSWMGWFNRGKEEPAAITSPSSATAAEIVYERKDVE